MSEGSNKRDPEPAEESEAKRQRGAEPAAAAAGGDDEEPPPPPPPEEEAEPEALPAGWTSAVDPTSGATYYISPQGVSSWERPGADAGAAAAAAGGGAAVGAAAGGAAAGAAAQTAAAAQPAAAAAFTAAPLPYGWKEETDPASGKKYYISPQGQSTWDRPAAENQPNFAPSVQAQVAQYRQIQEMTGGITAPEKQHGYLAAVAKMRQAELVRPLRSPPPTPAQPSHPVAQTGGGGDDAAAAADLSAGQFQLDGGGQGGEGVGAGAARPGPASRGRAPQQGARDH